MQFSEVWRAGGLHCLFSISIVCFMLSATRESVAECDLEVESRLTSDIPIRFEKSFSFGTLYSVAEAEVSFRLIPQMLHNPLLANWLGHFGFFLQAQRIYFFDSRGLNFLMKDQKALDGGLEFTDFHGEYFLDSSLVEHLSNKVVLLSDRGGAVFHDRLDNHTGGYLGMPKAIADASIAQNQSIEIAASRWDVISAQIGTTLWRSHTIEELKNNLETTYAAILSTEGAVVFAGSKVQKVFDTKVLLNARKLAEEMAATISKASPNQELKSQLP